MSLETGAEENKEYKPSLGQHGEQHWARENSTLANLLGTRHENSREKQKKFNSAFKYLQFVVRNLHKLCEDWRVKLIHFDINI